MSLKVFNKFLDEESLLSADQREQADSFAQDTCSDCKQKRLLPYSVALNIVLLVAAAALWLLPLLKVTKAYIPSEVFSPAQSAVEYKTVVFSGGLRGDKSAYQGSSVAVDSKWEDLYNDIGMSQISADMASRLPNATTPIAGDPSHYMVQLDVFHQLHCLNMMRKMVYPDVYHVDLTSDSEEAADNIYHMEHCYDQLRQALQCASDVSTIYWEWSVKKQKMFGNLRTTHTCKNFEKIQDWAKDHVLTREFDWFEPVEGAPLRIID